MPAEPFFSGMFEFALLVRLLMNARGMLLEYSCQPRPNNRVLATAGLFMNMGLSIKGYSHSQNTSLTSQPAVCTQRTNRLFVV